MVDGEVLDVGSFRYPRAFVGEAIYLLSTTLWIMPRHSNVTKWIMIILKSTLHIYVHDLQL